jgi:hypothetical protein
VRFLAASRDCRHSTAVIRNAFVQLLWTVIIIADARVLVRRAFASGGEFMPDEQRIVGKKWTVVCAVVGVLAGLFVTASDDLFELLRLGPGLRFPYQLLGVLAGGWLGATIGKRLDWKKHQRKAVESQGGSSR